MKIIISTLLSIITFTLNSNAQWKWLNPKPEGHSCTKVIFADSKNGFILNYNNDLLTTADQGETWNVARHFSNAMAMDMKDSIVVITGYNAIFLSTDNCKTWDSLTAPDSQIFTLVSIVNRKTFFVGNKYGDIYRTDDQGKTWQKKNIGTQTFALQFPSSNIGYASGSLGIIKKTINGGNTWDTIHFTGLSTTIYSIQFLDSNRGYAFMDSDSMLSTLDGGIHWKHTLITASMRSIYFTDTAYGYTAGSYGQVFKTVNGGTDWNLVSPQDSIYGGTDFLSVYFISRDTGFIVGYYGRILKTTNGGASWTAYSPVYRDITSIAFPDPAIGYATSGINIFKTIDSGNTWKTLNFTATNPSKGYSNFNMCHFFNNDTGFVFETTHPRICRTYDGGNSWTVANMIQSNTNFATGTMEDLDFYNDSSAYVTYFNDFFPRTLLRTKDWGESWDIVTNNCEAQGIFFVDTKNGFGASGQQILKTTDSGKSWTAIYTNPYDQVNSIWFTNPAKGFAACDDGILLQTSDSGKTWSNANVAEFNRDNYYKIKFYNKKIGYITVSGGGLYKTENGGENWYKENNFFWDLNMIDFTKDAKIYVAGLHGVILTNTIGRNKIDSLTVLQDDSCQATLSANITSVITKADSIFFEYGSSSYNKIIPATPFSAVDTSISVKVQVQNLLPDSIYNFRVKMYINGLATYSGNKQFTATRPIQPVITKTIAGDTLISSATTGNQWYLNGAIIPDATSKQYTVKASGVYTVKYSNNNCSSLLSAPYNFVYTAVTDISTRNENILVYPNPVINELIIDNKNHRNITVELTDMQGRVVLKTQFTNRINKILVQKLKPGMYLVFLTDNLSKKSYSRIILKK